MDADVAPGISAVPAPQEEDGMVEDDDEWQDATNAKSD